MATIGRSGTAGTSGTDGLGSILGRFSTVTPSARPVALVESAPAVSPSPVPKVAAVDDEIDHYPPRTAPGYRPGVTLVVADKDAYTGSARKGEPYMWTWIGAATWFYVRDYPIPTGALLIKKAK